ncbi:MAG TPA: gliding motility-associated C-terminal domain-containing protein, partial [Bacteroidales bacterium]|nr:gliding motility-associated C-terminal domain-containing protein [Bacteroidales bacterium]
WSTVPAQTTAIATGLAAGTYTVTVTDANLCTTTATVTITQPAAALSAAITAQTNVLCFGNATGSATVTASNGTPGYTYSWSTNPSQVTPTAIGLPVGSYIVTVTDNNGCSVTTGTTITQPLAPLAASITAQTNVLCFGNSTGSATITATGGTPGYTYSWSTIPPQTSIMATGMPAGNYTVTVTDNNGCSLTNLVVIFQPAILTATVSAMPGALCGYDSVGIVSVVAAGGVAPYSYNWSTGSNLSIINGLSAGTYSVTVTDNNGCSETASGTINLIPTVTPDFPALPSICYGKSAPMLGPISPNGIMGTWTPSYVSNTASGTYTFTPNPGQCANPQTLMVNVFPYTPVNFTAEPREGCVPLHVDFDYINNGAIDTNSLHWNFGNPMTTTDVSDLLSPDYTYTDDGAFVVSLTGVSYNGCQVTGYDTIHVWPTPFADFTTHPEPAETDNPKVEFYDQSIGADSWNWNFGDVASGSNNYSVLQYPTHIYSDSGYFTVRLIVANNHNCLDTAVKVVQIIESFVFFTPNAFTPEGDGNNEGFSGKGVGIDEDDFVMYIYDRWGKLMFKTYDLNAKWDGTDERTGKDCELGVYVWLISLRDKTGLQHTLKGVVTLIR